MTGRLARLAALLLAAPPAAALAQDELPTRAQASAYHEKLVEARKIQAELDDRVLCLAKVYVPLLTSSRALEATIGALSRRNEASAEKMKQVRATHSALELDSHDIKETSDVLTRSLNQVLTSNPDEVSRREARRLARVMPILDDLVAQARKTLTTAGTGLPESLRKQCKPG